MINGALEGIFFLISLLPLSLLYLISDIAYIVVFYLVSYRKKIVFDNISEAFPEKSIKDIHLISRQFYKHFCDNIFETIKLLTISQTSLLKRYQITNPELVNKLFDEKKNVIQYMAHYANWEWNAVLPLLIKYKVLTFYQTLRNSKIDELTKKVRERFGIVASESEKGFKTMLGFWKKGINTYTLMVGDQSPHVGRDKHWIKFLNHDTAFLTGTDRIARKFDHIIIFPFIKKVKRGYYQIELIVLQENSKDSLHGEIIENFARQLEKNIYHDPALWLWSHRRWKLNKKS